MSEMPTEPVVEEPVEESKPKKVKGDGGDTARPYDEGH